ncbi:hypothetical protein SERLADRAFT_358045 [Serpula lacrymans var. lacrymans S7.9]|uniref:FAD-binding domain-containing protein n=1 Tax=Serpula lacrymans var. lacrymans (strain S7.9) TaxID=578457 RepID=F8P879_SERL9|nr:uncharacterized protein SERLADRAFT_358045 [Serpula lacrymans var. lacrymans S7.9]EGO20635.1 hypothetical protein SERLADRAFT_358045 [Serpula lacrymans var. lacrymans S7.9]
MSLPESTTVLIVGAGPTGLAAALSLIHHGVRDFVIVDTVLQGQNTSRALVIHAATLEALNTIGCADELNDLGLKEENANIRSRYSKIFRVDFNSLNKYTNYAHALILPQPITERVLEDKLQSLGGRVYRPHTVSGLSRNKQDSTITDVVFQDGQIIKAKYVIGADGARSAIRNIAGIRFADPDGEDVSKSNLLSQIVLADVTFADESGVPDAGLNMITDSAGFFLFIRYSKSFVSMLPEYEGKQIIDNVYRVGFGVPVEMGTPPHAPPREYIQVLVDKFGPVSSGGAPPLKIEQVIWSTRFRTHSAIADRFFTRLGAPSDVDLNENSGEKEGGVILLVGDAAHIHSPAGGQGMNLGLRDAVALGDAIHSHINASQSSSSPSPSLAPHPDIILQTFAASRRARALEVIALTKSLLSVLGMKWGQYMRWCPVTLGSVRDCLLWIAGRVGWIRGMAAWRMSGLGMR